MKSIIAPILILVSASPAWSGGLEWPGWTFKPGTIGADLLKDMKNFNVDSDECPGDHLQSIEHTQFKDGFVYRYCVDTTSLSRNYWWSRARFVIVNKGRKYSSHYYSVKCGSTKRRMERGYAVWPEQATQKAFREEKMMEVKGNKQSGFYMFSFDKRMMFQKPDYHKLQMLLVHGIDRDSPPDVRDKFLCGDDEGLLPVKPEPYMQAMAQLRCNLMNNGLSYDEARNLSGVGISLSDRKSFEKAWAKASKTEYGIKKFATMMTLATRQICKEKMEELIGDSKYN